MNIEIAVLSNGRSGPQQSFMNWDDLKDMDDASLGIVLKEKVSFIEGLTKQEDRKLNEKDVIRRRTMEDHKKGICDAGMLEHQRCSIDCALSVGMGRG